MKLIDLLVRELPKRGGFIAGANEVVQDADGKVKFFDSSNLNFNKNLDAGRWCGKARAYFYCTNNNSFLTVVAEDYETAIVTREQYETALAASTWNGEGLPPVGCEFEYGTHRSVAKCIAVSYHHVFASKGDPDDENSDYEEFLIDIEHSSFYPVGTEADRKREGVTAALVAVCSNYNKTDVIHAADEIYDAIVAHRIDGITTVPSVSQIVRCTEKCSREDAERIIAMLTNGTISE